MASKLEAKNRREQLRRIMWTHNLTTADVARMCHVQRSTALAWSCGARNVPYRALRLLQLELKLDEL